jgi:metal-responsive CopG/Arc/MetJ family transcriptional regulator
MVLPIKRKRGRPYTGEDNRDPVTAIRLSEELRAEIDTWAARQPEAPSRSEAIRMLVQLGLTATKQKGHR